MGYLLADFLHRHRWKAFAAIMVAACLAALVAINIRFDFTPQAIFAASDDAVAFSEELKETFGYEDAVLLVLVESMGDKDVLARKVLQWQAERAIEFSRVDNVKEVLSVPTLEVPVVRLRSSGGVTLRRLVRRLPVTEQDEQRVRATVEQSPLMHGTFVSDDHRVGSIAIALDPDARQVDSLRDAVAAIEAILGQSPPPAGYRLRLGGLAALRLDIVDALQADLLWSVPIAAGIFFLALLIVFRGSPSIVATILTIAVALAWMIAVIVLAGEHLNIISNVLPLLLMMVGVSNCVHVLSRYAEAGRQLNGNSAEATQMTIITMTSACFLTYATTAIGFASLTSAQSDVLVAFGWQAAVGMGLLYLATIGIHGTLLPSFRPPPIGSKVSIISPVVAASGYFVARHAKLSVLGSVALIAISVWLGSGVSVDSYHVEAYDADHPMMETMQLLDEKLGGMIPLEVSLEANDPERFLEPAIYRNIAAVQQYAFDQPEILFARSYVDLHQELYAKRKHNPELRTVLPPLDELGVKRIARSHELLQRFNKQIHYHAFITEDTRRARILFRLHEVGTKATGELIKRLEDELATRFPPSSGIRYRITGDGFLNASRMDQFVRDLFGSLLMAAVTMFAIIALLFRSLRIGLIAALPNLTPLFITLGYMRLRGYDMNTSNVIVFAVSLGIAVDDTIHFLARFHAEFKHDGDVTRAIRGTLDGAGRAIITTSLLLLVGLAVLSMSPFVPTRRFAELTAVTIGAALIGDLLLLPGCLALMWKPRAKKTSHEEPATA